MSRKYTEVLSIKQIRYGTLVISRKVIGYIMLAKVYSVLRSRVQIVQKDAEKNCAGSTADKSRLVSEEKIRREKVKPGKRTCSHFWEIKQNACPCQKKRLPARPLRELGGCANFKERNPRLKRIFFSAI